MCNSSQLVAITSDLTLVYSANGIIIMGIVWICLSTLIVIKTSLATIPHVNFVWTNENCIGGDRGLLSTGLWLTFNVSDQKGNIVCSNRLWIEYNSSLQDYLGVPCDQMSNNISNATFEFEQPEHGGGLCHCVRIDIERSSSQNFS